MAIAFDNSTYGGRVDDVLTQTFSHTVNSNTDGILWVGVVSNDFDGTDHKTPTSVTYNGVSMTNATGANISQSQSGNSSLWYLVAPASGANNVVVTTPTNSTGSGNNVIRSYAISYTGAKQTGVPDSSSSNSAASGSTFSTSTTTALDNSWTSSLFVSNQATAISASTGTTLRQAAANGFNGAIGDSGAVITPAGSHTMNVAGGSGFWVGSIVSFAPSVASGPTNLKTVNGLAKASVKTVKGLAIASVKSINGLE